MVLGGATCAAAELLWPGSAAYFEPKCSREPILPHGPNRFALSDGRARNVRDSNRLAGCDLGCVLHYEASDSTRLSPSHENRSHVFSDNRSNLHSGDQLGIASRLCDARRVLRFLE